jgi:predicted lysophospholipase L1 biosynthesis ABC-type transport system permease subunit
MWITLYVPPVVSASGFSLVMFQAIGRLKPGVTPAQAAVGGDRPCARRPMRILRRAGGVRQRWAGRGHGHSAARCADGRREAAILVLLVAVFLLLTTATANAASLQLARAPRVAASLAIRAAIGAGKAQLVRQALTENVVFGLLGGVAGIALAAAMHQALPRFLAVQFSSA